MSDPVVVLWGESPFLLREGARQVLGDLRAEEVEGGEWRPGMTADLATPSLFGEERALFVANLQDASVEVLDELARYAIEANPEARLVAAYVVGARAKGPPQKITKRFQGHARIERVAVDRKELPRWVGNRAKAIGTRVTEAGANALIDTVGEDPAILAQSVAQLADAHPEEGITPATVASQFKGFGDRMIWDLCDAAFTGQRPAALRHLSAMLAAREQPLAILGGIASRLRDLLKVASVPPGSSPKELAAAAGLRFDWQARRYREQSDRYSTEELMALHERVAEADRLMKQGGAGDVVLSMLVTTIAREPARAR